LTEQLAVARQEYFDSKERLDKERIEFQKTEITLSRKDDYTVAIATALGEESNATEAHAQLRSEIADLTAQITQIEESIEYYKERQHTALVSALVRERAFYHAESENNQLLITQGIAAIQNGKYEVARITESPEFRNALRQRSELSATEQFHRHLRAEMNDLFRLFNETKPGKTVGRKMSAEQETIRSSHESKHQMLIELGEMENQRYYAGALAAAVALGMIDQIQVANQVLVSLGGEPVDTDELKAHFRRTAKLEARHNEQMKTPRPKSRPRPKRLPGSPRMAKTPRL
jgi:hypothetical protein